MLNDTRPSQRHALFAFFFMTEQPGWKTDTYPTLELRTQSLTSAEASGKSQAAK